MEQSLEMEPATRILNLITAENELSDITLSEAIQRTANILDEWEASSGLETLQPGVLAQSLRLVLAATSSGIGECRLALPYSPMRPINGSDGLKWCCNHKPSPH